MARDASHQDDAPAGSAVRNHLFRGQLGGVVGADDVYGEQLVVIFEGGIEKSKVTVDAGGRDADVELAGEVLGEGREACLQRLFRGDVDEVVLGAHVVRAGDQEEARRRRDDVKDGHIGAGFGEPFGKGETAATGAAGDKGGAPGEGELHGDS